MGLLVRRLRVGLCPVNKLQPPLCSLLRSTALDAMTASAVANRTL